MCWKSLSRAAFIVLAALICFGVPAQENTWNIYLRRAGPVRFETSLAEVRGLLGDSDASLGAADARDPDGDGGCAYLESQILPVGLGLMFIDGKVARVDVRNRAAAQTASGARVGDTEDRVKAMYPKRIRVEPHKYDPTGHYLIYTPLDLADKKYELLFETDGSRVTSFRSGLGSAVALVEGCS